MFRQSQLSDRESLERFKEEHPDLALARQIVDTFSEEEFVERFAHEFADGVRQARRVHQTAVLITEQTALLWANIVDIASPHWRQTNFNNIPDSFLEHLQQIPGFSQLFERLDFVECDHCRSILGPAAYFVDLMRFIKTHIAAVSKNDIAPEHQLLHRRPDLAGFSLDCDNTHTLIPYIDLINEVLTGVLEANGYDNPDRTAAKAHYPLSLPFHLPLFAIRTYLEKLKTSLLDIYRALGENDRITQETLGLFPADFHHLVGDLATPKQVEGLFNIASPALSGPDSLADLRTFREKTGLTRDEINELVYQDLDQGEMDAGLSRLFFINQTDDGLPPLAIEEVDDPAEGRYERLSNLSAPRLHRLHRFVKLAQYLDWSFTELDWALRSLGPPYRPETTLKFDGVSDYVAATAPDPIRLTHFTLEAWIQPDASPTLQPIVALRDPQDEAHNLLFAIDANGRLAIHVRGDAYSGHAPLPAGHFAHVAAAYDGERVILVQNGRIDAVIPLSPPELSHSIVEIGRDGSDYFFGGCIKDVRLWSAARTAPDIAAWRFRRLTGREMDLVAYWPLEENDWNRLDDLTGNGRDGVLGGAGFVSEPSWVTRDLILDPLPQPLAAAAYRFDGAAAYLAAAAVAYPAPLTSLTLEMSLRRDDVVAGDCTLISYGNRDNGRTQFSLELTGGGRLRFYSTGLDSPVTGQQTIPPDQPTHVAVVFSQGELTFYVNGRAEDTVTLAAAELATQGHDLCLGRRLTGGQYYQGEMQEVRLWRNTRSAAQLRLNAGRAIAPAAPGLIGYWRLAAQQDVADAYLADEGIEALAYTLAPDLSYHGNDLALGGLPATYQPERVDAVRLVPPAPVQTEGTVLQFDGDNDAVTLTNPADFGLGRYERWRITLWVRADEPQRKDAQVLLAQGDGEAGVILYLEAGEIHAALWRGNYERTRVEEIGLSGGPLQPGQWHFVTLASDESTGLDKVTVQLYLDGRLLRQRDDGYRLSPVGPIYLGGLPAGADVRLNEQFLAEDSLYHYFFRGQLAGLRLATTVSDPGEARRLALPVTDADLAFCPLDEGSGRAVRDRQTTNPHTGRLRQNNQVYLTAGGDDPAQHLYTHYHTPDALDWAGYTYSGRFRLTDPDQAIGFTVLSRRPRQIDQCYLLRRSAQRPSLRLTAHPYGIQTVRGELDSGVTPQPHTWHRFLIQVRDHEGRSEIRAKIWEDETAEPADFQITAVDDTHLRLTRGTVGVWAWGAGDRFVDDLTVWPGDGPEPETAVRLLDENFEAYQSDATAADWEATRVHYAIREDDELFSVDDVDGDMALAITGPQSDLLDLHTHYSQPAALGRGRYVYSGRFRLADDDQAIGFTVFSRFPEEDAYYRLGRDPIRPSFHLTAHPHGAHALAGILDGGVIPQAGVWYRFYIEAAASASATTIRAKVWPADSPEPRIFQIDARDEGENRLQAGTVGVWTLGGGARVVDDLLAATERPLADAFADETSLFRWTAVRQMRPGALRAFLNGKQVAVGDGCQLQPGEGASPWAINLGGPGAGVVLADGPLPAGTASHFRGQILDVRLWATARTGDEIRATYRGQLNGDERRLVAWRQFKPGEVITDLSGNGHDLPAPDSTRLAPIAEPSQSLSDTVRLDKATLKNLATLKTLRQRYSLSVERLCALWYDVKHVGRADRETLFDQIFNADNAAPRWPVYRDEPLRWDRTGDDASHRARRARLMGIFGLSSDDLDKLASHLNGDQATLDLDHLTLQQIYRLAALAKTLRLSVSELLALLGMVGVNRIDSLDDLRRVSDRAHWMAQTGVDVAEWRFLLLNEADAGNGRFRQYDEKAIRTQAEALADASKEEEAAAPEPEATGNGENGSDAKASAAEEAPPIDGVLAELLGVDVALVHVIRIHLAPEIGQQEIMAWLHVAAKPEESIPAGLWNYLDRANQLCYLATEFALTPAELAALLDEPAVFGVGDAQRLSPGDLEQLHAYRRLKAAWPKAHEALFALLQLPEADEGAVKTAVCELAGWERDHLEALVAYLELTPPLKRPSLLHRLHTCFALAARMGTNIPFLLQLAAGPKTDEDAYTFYAAQAEALRQVLRARHDEESWPTVYKPLHGQIAARRRDALLSLAMLTIPESFSGRRSPDVLSDYYLLDLQTGPEVETSRLVQALASLQLYVQRWRMNLEPGTLQHPIPEEEWAWMKNYRVWEANRKVFLYPENYIEPELRDTKTPFFEELEQDLQQTEFSNDAAVRIFNTYLNKFADVARLQVVGAYFHKGETVGANDDVLFLIGRTRTEPYTFYHRRLVYPGGDEGAATWEPWRKIDLSLPAETVTPVYAFGRLFLFWPELLEKSEEEGEGEEAVSHKAYQATVKYTYRDFNDAWQPPQTLMEREGLLREGEKHKPAFQRVYAQRIQDFNPADPEPGGGKKSLELDSLVRLEKELPLLYSRDFSLGIWVRLGAKDDELLQENARQTTTLFRVSFEFSAWEVWSGAGNLGNADLRLEAQNNNVENPVYTAAKAIEERLTQSQDLVNRAADAMLAAIAEKANWATHKQLIQSHLGPLNTAVSDLKKTITKAGQAGAADSEKAGLDGTEAIAALIDAAQDLISLIEEQEKKEEAKRSYDQTQLDNAQARAVAAKSAVSKALDTATQARAATPPWKIDSYTVTLKWDRPQEAIIAAYTISGNGAWRHLGLEAGWQTYTPYLDGVAGKTAATPHWYKQLWQPWIGWIKGVLSIKEPFTLSPQVTAPIYPVRLSEFTFTRKTNQIATLKGEPHTVAGVDGINLSLEEPIAGALLRLVDGGPPIDPPTINQTWWQAEKERIRTTRERLIIIYGDETLTMRGTGLDQSFKLVQRPLSQEHLSRFYDLNLSVDQMHLTITSGPSLNDYAAVDDSGATAITTVRRYDPEAIQHYLAHSESDKFLTDADRQALQNKLNAYERQTDSFAQKHYLFKHQAKYEIRLWDVHNRPGWYILETGDAQFLLQAVSGKALLDVPTTAKLLKLQFRQPKRVQDKVEIYYWFDPEEADSLHAKREDAAPGFAFRFVRLDTFTVGEMGTRLFTGGVDRLLNPDSQQLDEVTIGETNDNLVNMPPGTLDFDSANGIYFWEIFFHIPFLIANQLKARQKFEEAQQWYHYIFNPTLPEQEEDVAPKSDRFWRFLPFRSSPRQTLGDLLADESALAAYRDDPFDPHAIARLRRTAYQKAIVMKYIDNLLDWGDYLFAQDTRESINEAVTLYVFAYNLLGPRPEGRRVRDRRPAADYETIEKAHGGQIDDFLAQLETAVSPTDPATAKITPFSHIATEFGLVENDLFLNYWDRVEDRLYKIRHSLNIEGVFRSLALFQPPIDPRALVEAVAGGLSIGDALAGMSAPVPHYRYNVMLERAKEVTGFVIDLGDALLNALESRDAEKLAELQNRHEQKLLDQMTQIKTWEKEAAAKAVEAMNTTRESLTHQIDKLDAKISEYMSPLEITTMALATTNKILIPIKGALEMSSWLVKLLPEAEGGTSGISSPVVTFSVGPEQAEGAAKAGMTALKVAIETIALAAELTGKFAEYERRKNAWELEKEILEYDRDELDKQIEIAALQQQIAERERQIHETRIRQAGEVGDFYRRKFTNQELYNWMVGRLSALYFQAYNLAHDAAKAAEKALQYELPTDDAFIGRGHWDNLRKGLLAGQSLMLDLHRMEKAHLEQDSRFLEIEKTISMKRTFPGALTALMEEGTCEFELYEKLFNEDFPGHYCRLIKTISVSIKGDIDPYDGVKATLTQLSSKTVLQPDINAVRYLMGDESAKEPDAGVVRANWRANQQIAISRPDEDHGMFVLDFFFDDRYFPFEGAGAVSRWRLDIPKETNAFMDTFDPGNEEKGHDVVIHLRYTAKSDAGQFKQAVMADLK